jgi:hypothetical protein
MTFPCRPNKAPPPPRYDPAHYRGISQADLDYLLWCDLESLFGPHPEVQYDNATFALWGMGFLP